MKTFIFKHERLSNIITVLKMAPKREKIEMSAFERKRLENIAANHAILKDLGSSAAKILPSLTVRAKPRTVAPRKKEAKVKKAEVRPLRTSLRIAGIGADSETAKRKAEDDSELAKEQTKAKRQRVIGELKFADMVVDGKKFSNDDKFLSGIMKGAQPNVRTFTEADIKETTNESLKSLRERISGLQLYDKFEPSQIKITPERIFALGFHPSHDKPLIFAGDKDGNLGIFDASQAVPDVTEEDDDDDKLEAPEPTISALKIHAKTITCLKFSVDGDTVYSSSYDSSVRKFDLHKGVAVEAFAPSDESIDLPISCIDIPSSNENTLYFSTLDGSLGRHDLRTKSDADIWELGEKKIGGFSLHPLHPHLIATASLDRTLKIWDVRNIRTKAGENSPALLGEHESRLSVSHAAWSASGHIATSSYDDTIKIYAFSEAGTFKAGHKLTEDIMAPTTIIKHNNQTGRWVTILKPHWQEKPQDGIAKFVIGNMNRFIDVFSADGEQLAQLSGDGITAVPAVTHFHPSQDWIAGGTASGKLCLWM